MTYSELKQKLREHNENKPQGEGYHENVLTAEVTFTEDSFSKPFSHIERTYRFTSNNKAFIPGMGGYSIFADCLDGIDKTVRIEQYMAAEKGGKDGWKIESCKLVTNTVTFNCRYCGSVDTSSSEYIEKSYTKEVTTCYKCHDKAIVESGLAMISKMDKYEQYYTYLDGLRESGVTNMYGAAPYLQIEFPYLTPKEAQNILVNWMATFKERYKERIGA